MPSGKKPATIRLTNMIFHAYHGVTTAEKEIGCQFEVDCEYNLNIDKASATDSLEQTIDYSMIYETISDITLNNKFNLVETLARRLADAVLDSFNLSRVKINVRKVNPPMTGDIDYYEVEIERTK